MVSHTYDPWGVPTVTGDADLAALNPCSYRGYDYDEETGYYYLQSRYYDPEIGRFNNADGTQYLGAGNSLVSYNIFSYCQNNSINYCDSTGCAPYLGWGVQAEGSFMGFVGGIEFIWFSTIAKSMYGGKKYPCIYLYGGFSLNQIGGNLWNIKELIKFVTSEAVKMFASSRKAAWKIGGSFSICAFRVYGTITSPYQYTGPFISTGATIAHIKAYYSRSPSGNVQCWGIGVSTSAWGFSPISYTGYLLVPPSVVITMANWLSSLCNKMEKIATLA